MELSVTESQEVMASAVAMAGDPSSHSHPEFAEWEKRISEFSQLVTQVGYKQSIALIGSALIAKATNTRIDVMSIKVRDTALGSYNARGPAENVLYPASLIHKFDIGSESRNPLNGATFLRLSRIDTTFKLKGAKGNLLATNLVAVLYEISHLKDRESGIRALAAYVRVRRRHVRRYDSTTRSPGLSTRDDLINAITKFVNEKSEGGGRAQAAVGGLFDTLHGADRVRVGKTNEPDRKEAGDVVVRESAAPGARVVRAIEVRHKLVTEVDVLSIIQKLQRAGLSKGAVVAVAPAQAPLDSRQYSSAAETAGVQIHIFEGWPQLIHDLFFWCDCSELAAVQSSIENIRTRVISLALTEAAVVMWDSLTRQPKDQQQAECTNAMK